MLALLDHLSGELCPSSREPENQPLIEIDIILIAESGEYLNLFTRSESERDNLAFLLGGMLSEKYHLQISLFGNHFDILLSFF